MESGRGYLTGQLTIELGLGDVSSQTFNDFKHAIGKLETTRTKCKTMSLRNIIHSLVKPNGYLENIRPTKCHYLFRMIPAPMQIRFMYHIPMQIRKPVENSTQLHPISYTTTKQQHSTPHQQFPSKHHPSHNQQTRPETHQPSHAILTRA